jgi:hypothetical protein
LSGGASDRFGVVKESTSTLANGGHRVTGIDLSEVKITRAWRLLPNATSLQVEVDQVSSRPEL